MPTAPPQKGRARNPRGSGDHLRTEIIAAAERLLRGQPVEALSLRAVAREAGVSPTALYLHFADRRALVWAVLEHQSLELAAATTQAVARFTRPEDQLRAWCLTYCHFGITHPGRYRALFESWSAERVDTPLTNLPGYPLWGGLTALIASSGSSIENLDELSTLIWSALHGFVSLRINKPSFPWPPIDALIDALLERLLPQPQPS